MTNNFPIEQQNQHEHPKLSYEDYISAPIEAFASVASREPSAEVEIEMSRSIQDMRRQFHRTVKKFKNHFADMEPRASIYKFGYTYPTGIHFSKRRAMG
jgi:uncharacterized protein (DUF2461 family)